MRAAAAFLIVLALGACATPSGGFCDTAEPIRLSPSAIDALSDAEVEAILSHNEYGRSACGWRPSGA